MIANSLQLVQPTSGRHLDSVRELFHEYQESLGIDLCFQGFQEELLALPGPYAPPSGRLYLGLADGQPACCVGLRRLDAAVAEMKRLYVRPSFRGRGHGRLLARTVIAEARLIGYTSLVLDTLPTMHAAQAMYIDLGFRDMPPYTFNPIPGTRFMLLVLEHGTC